MDVRPLEHWRRYEGDFCRFSDHLAELRAHLSETLIYGLFPSGSSMARHFRALKCLKTWETGNRAFFSAFFSSGPIPSDFGPVLANKSVAP